MGKVGLNILNQVGNIVAPISDDEAENVDAKSQISIQRSIIKSAQTENKSTSNANLGSDWNDREYSELFKIDKIKQINDISKKVGSERLSDKDMISINLSESIDLKNENQLEQTVEVNAIIFPTQSISVGMSDPTNEVFQFPSFHPFKTKQNNLNPSQSYTDYNEEGEISLFENQITMNNSHRNETDMNKTLSSISCIDCFDNNKLINDLRNKVKEQDGILEKERRLFFSFEHQSQIKEETYISQIEELQGKIDEMMNFQAASRSDRVASEHSDYGLQQPPSQFEMSDTPNNFSDFLFGLQSLLDSCGVVGVDPSAHPSKGDQGEVSLEAHGTAVLHALRLHLQMQRDLIINAGHLHHNQMTPPHERNGDNILSASEDNVTPASAACLMLSAAADRACHALATALGRQLPCGTAVWSKDVLASADTAVAAASTICAELEEVARETVSVVESLRLLREVRSEEQEQRMTAERQTAAKFEAENRQLHEVIGQLRQARRVDRGGPARLDELQRELEQCRVAATAERERESVRLTDLDEQLRRVEQTVKQQQQVEYEVRRDCEYLRTEALLRGQQLQSKTQECANMLVAVQRLEREKELLAGKVKLEAQQSLAAAVLEQESRLSQLANAHEQQLQELRGRLETSEQKCADEGLWRRKAEFDFHTEKRRLQQRMEDSMAQLRNSGEDSVDRTLVSNLIVSYFKRKRSADVLVLIAKILKFTDEEKLIVGLKPPPLQTSLTNSLFSILRGTSTQTSSLGAHANSEDEENRSLAELWVNFLLDESSVVPTAAAATP